MTELDDELLEQCHQALSEIIKGNPAYRVLLSSRRM